MRRKFKKEWLPYDPSELIKLAREQYPEKEWLIEELKKCTKYLKESSMYYYFVDPDSERWKGGSVTYEFYDERRAISLFIVLDILKDRSVGGVEFIPDVDEAVYIPLFSIWSSEDGKAEVEVNEDYFESIKNFMEEEGIENAEERVEYLKESVVEKLEKGLSNNENNENDKNEENEEEE
ncbi:MAG TPA: hypothetical protein PLE45_04220 [Spirochaetota bacterium]|nr:hypothetical protein [Spirochaetota bacterium]HOL57081.1 hypothetical protein [Spirochaetota bacterium]HPP04690.1 hypothetical protein [Spirochaetota bacterium]